MEKTIYDSIGVICLLIFLVFALKGIQIIWVKILEIRERKDADIRNTEEQKNIHARRLEILNKQEEIRKLERPHEIEMKKIEYP